MENAHMAFLYDTDQVEFVAEFDRHFCSSGYAIFPSSQENYDWFRTPLQIAASKGDDANVQLLLQSGAHINEPDFFGLTPLILAAEKGHTSCVLTLLRAGANCNVFAGGGCDDDNGIIFNLCSALYVAAARNKVECVKLLIQYGADYAARDKFGRTSLYIAAKCGFRECVLAHVESGIGSTACSLPCFRKRDTPFHFVVRYGFKDCVQALLRVGADISYRNRMGYTPLNLAATEAANTEILRIILKESHQLDEDVAHTFNLVCWNTDDPRKIVEPETYGKLCIKGRYYDPDIARVLLAYADINNLVERFDCLLRQEANFPDEEYGFLKRLVDSLSCIPKEPNLSEPEEFLLSPHRRKALARALLASPERIADDDHFSLTRIRKICLSLKEPEISEKFELFWPPPEEITELGAEACIAFQLSNQARIRDMPYEVVLRGETELYSKICRYRKLKWYNEMASNPKSLQKLCRCVIRRSLPEWQLSSDVERLPIPTRFKSFLLFEDEN